MTAVEVSDLRIDSVSSGLPLLQDVAFRIDSGKVLGLVGESGSGKSTLSLALMGFARRGSRIAGGRVIVDGLNLLSLDTRELRNVRGRLVSYMPQDPAASLNPSMRIGEQLIERLMTGVGRVTRKKALERVSEVLQDVRLPPTACFKRRFVGELSGGQQQRVLIAMAVAARPRLIILDEPTTGLDVSTQRDVLDTLKRLCARYQVAALYVSHDLSVVAHLAHHVLVLYGGRAVEFAECSTLMQRPAHPYTAALLSTMPSVNERRELRPIAGYPPYHGAPPLGCVFQARCHIADSRCSDAPDYRPIGVDHFVRCIRPHTSSVLEARTLASPEHSGETKCPALSVRNLRANHADNLVVQDISFDLAPGECLALVGESGSGKSTLSRCLVGLHASWSGELRLNDSLVAPAARDRNNDARRCIQYVFQNPYGSLHPRRRVGDSVFASLQHFFGLVASKSERRVVDALVRVGLSPELRSRFPTELSGGERQRVALARALVCEPTVLVCDEVTSALDVSVQASVVELLRGLVRAGLSILFVTHNLAVVRSLADRVMVLNGGRLVEMDSVERVFTNPTAEFTERLIAETIDLQL